jgi:hypothetical protein
MRGALALTAALLGAQSFATSTAAAQTVEELKAALAAQLQINALQRQRIDTLEAERSGRKIAAPATSKESPERAAGDPEEEGALERVLVRRGTAVLPPYVAEVTPGFAWSHSGSDFNSSTQNSYAVSLDARIGLPGGWMIGGAIPFRHRDIAGVGDNTGLGDVSATVSKSILTQTDTQPSLVGSLRYTAPTGENFSEDPVALGSGFHSLTGRLSTSKRIDPIAFYGDVSYTHFLGERIRDINLNRSDVIGFGLGTSLAVTPDISVSTGLNFSFEDEVKANGTKIKGSGTTIGQVELGVGIVLTKDIFLTLNGAFGVTADSPDVSLGMSLPMRF